MDARAASPEAQLGECAARLSTSTDSSMISSSSSSEGSSAEVDELPGSIQSSADISDYAKIPYVESFNALMSGRTKKTRRRRKSRQERTSDLILSARKIIAWRRDSTLTLCLTLELTTLPVAGVLLYNFFVPVQSNLTTSDTRTPSYHLAFPLHKFIHLSYAEPTFSSLPFGAPYLNSSTETNSTSSGLTDRPTTYLKGVDDIYFIAFWVLSFTLFRECVMRFLFVPLGRWLGVSSSKNLLRFGEAGYDIICHPLKWWFGFWIMQNSEYRYLRLEGLWQGYPHFRLGWEIKTHYLIQTAFWLQQIITLNVEKRRKDYYQVTEASVSVISLTCEPSCRCSLII